MLGKFSGRPPHISDLIHDAIATLYFPRVTSPVGGPGVGCAVYQINESVGMPKGPFPRWKESDILIRNSFDSALSP